MAPITTTKLENYFANGIVLNNSMATDFCLTPVKKFLLNFTPLTEFKCSGIIFLQTTLGYVSLEID